MVTAIDVSFLDRLCETRIEKHKLSKPFHVVLDGQPYALATDGYMAVGVKTPELLSQPDGTAPNFSGVLLPLPVGVRVKLADLKEFLGPPTWPDLNAKPEVVDCDGCNGTGWITGECDSCGRDEDEECGECDGQGKLDVFEPHWPEPAVYRVVGGTIIDRERLARCLDAFTDDFVTVAAQPYQLFAYTDAWLCKVMAIRDVKLTGLPAFDVSPAHSE